MNQKDAALLPDDIPALEAEMDRLGDELAATEQRILYFMAAEDPCAGIYYPREIHELKQSKLRLQTEKEFCRKKIARLKLD